MPKVKVSKAALTAFERAAAEQGVPVEKWLTAAGRRSLEGDATNMVEAWRTVSADVIDLVAGPGLKGVIARLRPIAMVGDTILFTAVDYADRISFEIQLRTKIECELSRFLGRGIRAAVTLSDQPAQHPAGGSAMGTACPA